MTEGRKASSVSKIELGPLLSSKSGCATTPHLLKEICEYPPPREKACLVPLRLSSRPSRAIDSWDVVPHDPKRLSEAKH